MTRAGRVLRNAFRSPGRRIFGPPFTRDYLRLAVTTAQRWGATAPGEIDWLGARLAYLNRSHAVFLLHEIFVNAEYAFDSGRPDPLIVDCGANIGVATLFFKRLLPRARVIAFEPHPTTFGCLARNVDANHLDEVRILQAAVGDADGTVALYANAADPGSLTASVLPAAGATAESVRVVRLSTLIDQPVDFLKLDIEGPENEVVDDLAETGTIARIRQMVIETHDAAPDRPRAAALETRLRQAGFTTSVRVLPGGLTSLMRATGRTQA